MMLTPMTPLDLFSGLAQFLPHPVDAGLAVVRGGPVVEQAQPGAGDDAHAALVGHRGREPRERYAHPHAALDQREGNAEIADVEGFDQK